MGVELSLLVAIWCVWAEQADQHERADGGSSWTETGWKREFGEKDRMGKKKKNRFCGGRHVSETARRA